MSEYQYYEFAAIDQPLTPAQQAELRAISTRAQITPTSFVNTYQWGDLKADPRRLVERYFDAFLYLANWGTRRLMFRLPAQAVASPDDVAERYCVGYAATAWRTDGHVIVDLTAEDDEADDWVDGSGLLASIAAARADLAAGDTRLLYLAWLLAVQSEELDEDAVEPPVPAGLGRLSASLRAVVEFLRIDQDLLAVAAQLSAPASTAPPAELPSWLAALPATEKDELLLRVAQGDGVRVRVELLSRSRQAVSPEKAPESGGRTVGEMLALAGERREERRRAAQEAAERRAAERRRAADRAREQRLTELAGRQEQAWREVAEAIERRTAADYDAAVALLQDLAEVYRRQGWAESYADRVEQLRQDHRRKTTFIDRLNCAQVI